MSAGRHSPDSAPASALHAYWRDARAPIHSLILLAPLAAAVEIGGWLLRGTGTIRPSAQVARSAIEALVSPLGIVGNWIPPLALLATLVWLTHRSGRWRPAPRTPPLMLAESLLLAVPLLVFARLIGGLIAVPAWPPARLLDVIGAGLYEELVFRLYLISLLLWLIGLLAPALPRSAANAAAVVIAALTFSALHFQPVGGEPFGYLPLIARSLAGCYLGYVFLQRGFGITALAHASYNALVLGMN